jgi:uncharacterized membrane protein
VTVFLVFQVVAVFLVAVAMSMALTYRKYKNLFQNGSAPTILVVDARFWP